MAHRDTSVSTLCRELGIRPVTLYPPPANNPKVAVMALPPSAAPMRRAPPQGRLCGRSSVRSERRRFAALVAVLAGAPVSVARPRPRPKGTTVPGKPAPCVSRASPDPGYRPINAPHRSAAARSGCRWHTSPPVTSAPGRSGLRDIAQVTMRTPRAAPTRPSPTATGAGIRYRSVPVLHCQSGRFVRRSCSPFPAGFLDTTRRTLQNPRGPVQSDSRTDAVGRKGRSCPCDGFRRASGQLPYFGLPSFCPRFRKLTLDVGNHESRKIPLASRDGRDLDHGH